MNCTLNDFIILRETIIKNHILNKLLLSALSRLKTSETALVGVARLSPAYETLRRFNEKGTPITTDSLLYDIIVRIQRYYNYIGIRYPGHPIIWEKSIFLNDTTEVSKLKFTAQIIFETYPLQTTYILKPYPNEFKEFLETSQISVDAWRNGSISLKLESDESPVSTVVLEYQKQLNNLLLEYRILNMLLICLLKNNRHSKLTLNHETLIISPSVMSDSFLFEYRNAETGDKYSDILYLYELTPKHYTAKNHKILLSLIQKLLNYPISTST